MRQLFTLGFWMSLLALVGLTFGLIALTNGDEPVTATLANGGLADGGLAEREIDLIAMVFVAEADPGLTIVAGRTTAAMRIRIDGLRYIDIPASTPGENRCPALAELAQCAVAADLLGESVLWFSIVPIGRRNTVQLPAITELRESSRVLLANGWLVRRAEQVERDCTEDSTSLTDFVRRFSSASTTTFSLDDQRVIATTCTLTPAP